jgi:hypothetical protein
MFNWSRNKHLTVLWLLFMLDFIASAVVLGVVSAVWRSEDTSVLDQNTLRRLTISDSALTGPSPSFPPHLDPTDRSNASYDGVGWRYYGLCVYWRVGVLERME